MKPQLRRNQYSRDQTHSLVGCEICANQLHSRRFCLFWGIVFCTCMRLRSASPVSLAPTETQLDQTPTHLFYLSHSHPPTLHESTGHSQICIDMLIWPTVTIRCEFFQTWPALKNDSFHSLGLHLQIPDKYELRGPVPCQIFVCKRLIVEV